MEEERYEERVKIRTTHGRILTVDISRRSATHLFGKDKFGSECIIPIAEIDSMLPISGTSIQQIKEKGGQND